MKEPAHWFFALLSQAFKLEADESLRLISISAFPHMDKGDARSLISGYERAAYDMIEAIDE